MQRTPVVLIHGAWFHMSSWEAWEERFAAHGFTVHVPGWPGEAATAALVRRDPGPLRDLGLAELTGHYARIVRSLVSPPVLIGHSAGGLIAQQLLGAGLGRAAAALAPLSAACAPPYGARPRPWSLLPGGAAGHPGAEPFSRAQFRHLVANAVGEEEAARLFERYAVPAPLRLLAELGFGPAGAGRAGAGPDGTGADAADQSGTDQSGTDQSGTDQSGAGAAPVLVDTANPSRGPLLLVSGQEDRLVPDAATRAVYKLYGDSSAPTELKQFADRGHSLVCDSGWRTIADYVLSWLAAHDVDAMAPRD